MIPATEAEAIAELKRVRDANGQLIKAIEELVADVRYPYTDREGLKTIATFIQQTDDIIGDVVQGLSAIGIAKQPTQTSAIIAALTE